MARKLKKQDERSEKKHKIEDSDFVYSENMNQYV